MILTLNKLTQYILDSVCWPLSAGRFLGAFVMSFIFSHVSVSAHIILDNNMEYCQGKIFNLLCGLQYEFSILLAYFLPLDWLPALHT